MVEKPTVFCQNKLLMKTRMIEGPYLLDVLAQPAALRETERALELPASLRELGERVEAGSFSRVVLTGMGSSYHALHRLHLDLVAAGKPAIMVETSELITHMPGLLRSGVLLVIVSQSGASAEVVRLLGMIPEGVQVVAVTNTPESTLASRAHAIVLTHAGQESTVSCKTYLAALMGLAWLSGVLRRSDLSACRADLAQAAPLVASYLDVWRQNVETLRTQMEGVRSMFLVGRGASLSTTGVGGLIIKESAHFHAEGMSSAAFRHGPFEMLSSAVYVAVLEGDAASSTLNRRLYQDVLRAGARGCLVTESHPAGPFRLPAGPELIRPILEMLPVEMFSFALAALAGREAGKFELGSKITVVE